MQEIRIQQVHLKSFRTFKQSRSDRLTWIDRQRTKMKRNEKKQITSVEMFQKNPFRSEKRIAVKI